ncbi:L,D-transpeptidase family protein [Fusobacterium sp. MFO224]|uniref:L,D-transpeptidase family protein n=1 Tax=Fusobacterium sp. MFO224 TaxID=3378070 RepID=UPI003854249A
MSIKKRLLIVLFLMMTTLSFSSTVKAVYENKIPSTIRTQIKYKGSDLPKLLNYVFIKTVKGNIRKRPSSSSTVILRAPFNTKFKALEKIQVRKNIWYKVQVGNEIGYVSGKIVHFKQFRFEEMESRIKKLEKFIDENNKKGLKLVSINSYKPNPYNKDMSRKKDKYGVSLDQNIIGEYKPENLILHVPDRSIMAVLSEQGKYAMVDVEGIKESPLQIDKSYIANYPNIAKGFKKAIAVDLRNQNLGIFEKINGKWSLVSYIYGKTGLESTLGFETPRGSYVVPNVKYEMEYRDNYGRDSGMARYAIRFSGGGYLHGTPLEHIENKNKDFFLDEKERGLGTYRGTRKCIRNTEEHARFLFDWVLEGQNRNINSNYQRPKDNVMFVIF